MNELAQRGIRQLKEAWGVSLDPVAHLDVIETILKLADQVLNPRDATAALMHPVLWLGDQKLKRLPIGCKEFLADYVQHWFQDDGEMLTRSLACLMATPPAEVWKYQGDQKGWKKAVKKWCRGLDLDDEALAAELDKFLDMEPTELDEGGQPETEAVVDPVLQEAKAMGWLFELLMNNYPGHTLEYWAWECPEVEMETLVKGFLNRKYQEVRAAQKDKAPDPGDPHVKAMYKFRTFIKTVGDTMAKEKEVPHG